MYRVRFQFLLNPNIICMPQSNKIYKVVLLVLFLKPIWLVYSYKILQLRNNNTTHRILHYTGSDVVVFWCVISFSICTTPGGYANKPRMPLFKVCSEGDECYGSLQMCCIRIGRASLYVVYYSEISTTEQKVMIKTLLKKLHRKYLFNIPN